MTLRYTVSAYGYGWRPCSPRSCINGSHDFPDMIMVLPSYPVVYLFLRCKVNLPVFTATRTGNFPVPEHGKGES